MSRKLCITKTRVVHASRTRTSYPLRCSFRANLVSQVGHRLLRHPMTISEPGFRTLASASARKRHRMIWGVISTVLTLVIANRRCLVKSIKIGGLSSGDGYGTGCASMRAMRPSRPVIRPAARCMAATVFLGDVKIIDL